MHVYVCARIYVHMFVCTCMFVYMYMYVYMRVQVRVRSCPSHVCAERKCIKYIFVLKSIKVKFPQNTLLDF